MISRIRVEARAASMDEAKREIEIVLDHATNAAFLEGLVGGVRRQTDDHYGECLQIGDPWSEQVGLRGPLKFEGRQAVTFEPEVVEGGLKMYGFEVRRLLEAEPPEQGNGGWAVPDLDDVSTYGKIATDDVIVLDRQRPVTRVHTWEKSSVYGTLGQEHEPGDLAVFNRARHARHGELIVEVWMRGPYHDGRGDQITNVYGTVSVADKTQPDAADTGPLWSYSRDVAPGEAFDDVVEEVQEKAGICADGMNLVATRKND